MPCPLSEPLGRAIDGPPRNDYKWEKSFLENIFRGCSKGQDLCAFRARRIPRISCRVALRGPIPALAKYAPICIKNAFSPARRFVAAQPGIRARSSAGEHYVDIVGVAGSIPAAPTIFSNIFNMLLKIGALRASLHSRPSQRCHSERFGMASIRKRHGKWQVQVRRKARASVTRTFEQKADAQLWARKTELELDRRDVRADTEVLKRVTLNQLIDRYLREIVPRKRSADVETFILHAFQRSWLAALPLDAIDRSAILRYRDERCSAVKASTVHRELGVVRNCLNVARTQWGVPLEKNPLAEISMPTGGEHRERRLSATEETQLLKAARACRNPLIEPLIVLSLETSMRQGELLRARWTDLDILRGELKIPITKNGHPRTIPLTDKVLATIERLSRSELFLFPTTASAVKQAWRRCVRRANLNDLRFHDLRHEAVSRFIEMGLTIPEVAAISGHRDHRVLLRYAHHSAARLREKLQAANSDK